ncbi:MAG TPA: response regulator, partial [Candidatus Atribacteria bacterium]|nr:response regulator [Candidatus Atribacteria bacterium]
EYIPKYYLLLSTGIRNFAIPVEDIIDEKSMIVRPLSDCIKKKLSLFNAFSIYQSGKLIPIIDSQKLYALRSKSQSIEEDLKKDYLEKEINSVLIVEDATVTRKMESMIMEEEGFKVYEASNGREAIEVLSNIPIPSLIITDIEMPILDGVEFVKYVKEELNLSIPIVVVTTLSKEELDKRNLKPVDLIIPKKDFAERKFIEKIRKLVKAKK